jgi:hypothetical protein
MRYHEEEKGIPMLVYVLSMAPSGLDCVIAKQTGRHGSPTQHGQLPASWDPHFAVVSAVRLRGKQGQSQPKCLRVVCGWCCSRSWRPERETEPAACALFTATPRQVEPFTRPASETGENACVPKLPTFQTNRAPRCRAWTWTVAPSAHQPLAAAWPSQVDRPLPLGISPFPAA